MEKRHPLVLDTTFVLPLFGIDVKELSSSDRDSKKFETLWNHGIPGFDLILPTTSLMEVVFKLNGEYRKQQDGTILERYGIGIPTVKESRIVQLFEPLTSPACATIASKVRLAGHEDVLDCLIASCAIVKKGVFLTEDDDLVKVLVENQFLNKYACVKWTKIASLLQEKPK
jgi:hypothetical protein